MQSGELSATAEQGRMTPALVRVKQVRGDRHSLSATQSSKLSFFAGRTEAGTEMAWTGVTKKTKGRKARRTRRRRREERKRGGEEEWERIVCVAMMVELLQGFFDDANVVSTLGRR